ncbi:hypothetical protein PV797_04325 [Clostridiaceae bacterium M8S5]|nr:hypothetical protein PV797_04325 [Clostridiaceae bacterium M8S5]
MKKLRKKVICLSCNWGTGPVCFCTIDPINAYNNDVSPKYHC